MQLPYGYGHVTRKEKVKCFHSWFSKVENDVDIVSMDPLGWVGVKGWDDMVKVVESGTMCSLYYFMGFTMDWK